MLASVLGFLVTSSGCTDSSCAEGFIEVEGLCFDPNAACGVQCQEHEVCDISVVPNECRCAAGFEGDPCDWVGVIADPSFQTESDADGSGGWREEGAFVNPDARDNPAGGLGEGEFRPAAICSGGMLSQVVDMPTVETGGPLVADVIYRVDGAEGLGVGTNGTWVSLPPTGDDYEERTFCLGEGAYWVPDADDLATIPAPRGGPVLIQLSASERLESECGSTESSGTIRVDYFDIRPFRDGDEACPLPASPPLRSGTINPDANPSGGGWSFDCSPVECVDSGLLPDPESERDSVARISRPAGADYLGRMTTRVSVPLPVEGRAPALTFWWRGSNERLFPVEIGTFGSFVDERPRPARALETLVGRGGGRPRVYCLPEWTYGSVVDLTFALPEDGVADEVVLAVDQVVVTNDSDCGAIDELNGFESVGTNWPGSSIRSVDQLVTIVPGEPLDAPSEGVLNLSYGLVPHSVAQDSELRAEAFVRVSDTGADEGPAVEFFAAAETSLDEDVEWVLGASCLAAEASPCACRGAVAVTAAGWERNLVCLPKSWTGRWFRFGVEISTPAGEATPESQERADLYIDRVTATSSPDCACP
jgi:hypothetical protein